MEARKALVAGIDPNDRTQSRIGGPDKEAENASVKRRTHSRMLLAKGGSGGLPVNRPRHADYVLRCLKANVSPAYGRKFIDAVMAADIRELMLAIKKAREG